MEREKNQERIEELRAQYKASKYPENVAAGKELDELEGNIFRTELKNGGLIDTRPDYGPGGREFCILIDLPEIRELQAKTERGEEITDDEFMLLDYNIRLFDMDGPDARERAREIHELAVKLIDKGRPLLEVFERIRDMSL